MTFGPSSSPALLAPQSAVALRGTAYVLSWWFVLLMHVTTAAFVLIAAFVHLALSVPMIHDNTPALLITMTLKRVSGVSYFVVTVLHCRAVFQMTSQSIHARELVFRYQKAPIKELHSTPSRYRQLAHAWSSLRWAFFAVLGSEGVFGIHGRFFNVAVLLRETVEIALQTYQLWSLSHSVSRVWINTFAVMTIVVNCWSIPSVHAAFRRHEPTRRLAHLVADMLLDFVCGIVIPVCVMVPYLLDFDWAKRDFPPELMSNDVWFGNAVAEGRQVLVTSFLDLFSSLLPQYGIYACLRLLKRLVVRSSHASPTHGRLAIVPISQAVGFKSERKRSGRGLKTVSYTLGLWGCLVLALHIKTSIQSQQMSIQGCRLYLRPWFVSKVPCAVVYVNCYRHGISGIAQETSAILDQLERSVTTRVIFAHCPTLTVPKEITSLYSLSGVIIHNSTLIDWPRESAIKQATHPAFIGVIIGSSSIREIPDGLFHDELPHAMTSMMIHNCSVSQIPDSIGDVWATSKLRRLSFESSRVRSIPASLGRIRLTHLMLTDNLIEELPEDLFATLRLDTLGLSMNPLRTLPQSGGDTSVLRELLVEYTNVSTLPPWALSWLQDQQLHGAKTRAASLFGSPACDQASSLIKSSGACERDLDSVVGTVRVTMIQQLYPL